MGGSEAERIRQCASSNGWKEGEDYVVGHRMIWLTYPAWKVVDDVLRASEKDHKRGGTEVGDDESVLPDDATEYTHQESLTPGAYYGGGESEDNLLLTRTGTHGTQYRDPAFPTPHTPSNPETPAYSDAEGWGSEWDKKGGSATPPDAGMSKEGDLVAKAPNTVEEVPTSRSRRNWLYVVKATTWWIPAVALSKLGRMKRPDIQLAWREKVTIFWLIFLFNCIVIFYIIEFGRLLCPDFDKAWSLSEVNQHTGDNDFWVTIQGTVYDVSNFIHGQHSDVDNLRSNTADILEQVAGQDLTEYFPPPIRLACQGLVSDSSTVQLTPANQTTVISQVSHKSGFAAPYQNSKLTQSDWYTAVFLPRIRQFRKGPLVWTKAQLEAAAGDPDNQRYAELWW